MKQKGNTLIIIVLVLIVVGLIVYFWNRSFSLIGNYGRGANLAVFPSATETPTSTPVIVSPSKGAKFVNPQIVRGTVPPGWMFEGTFPVKLLDSNRNLIVQAAAVEEVPGAWQSNVPVYFTVTLNFSTKSKTGFLVFENDNPSGDPAKLLTFEIPVTF